MGIADTFIVLGHGGIRTHGSSGGLLQLFWYRATLTVSLKSPSCDQSKWDGVTLTLQLPCWQVEVCVIPMKTKYIAFQRRTALLLSQYLYVINELTDKNTVLINCLEGLGPPGGYDFLLSFTRHGDWKTDVWPIRYVRRFPSFLCLMWVSS